MGGLSAEDNGAKSSCRVSQIMIKSQVRSPEKGSIRSIAVQDAFGLALHKTTTMTARWSPDALLRIRGNAQEGGIQCSGTNRSPRRWGQRCGWRKWRDNADSIEVQKKLPSLGRKPVAQVTLQDLTELAELCLCRDRHFDQKNDLAKKWMEQVDELAAIEAELPTYPMTPETKHIKYSQPVITFGLPTPPSSQNTSQNNSFTFAPPVDSPIPPPAFAFKANDVKPPSLLGGAIVNRDALHLENKMLKSSETQLTARLNKETTAKQDVEKKLGDAQTKISNLSSEIKSLNARLAEVELDRAIAKDELAGARQQADTLTSVRDRMVEESESRLAAQRKELTGEKDRELQAAHFQYTDETIRLKEKSATDLEVQARGYKILVQQAEKDRDDKVQSLENQLAAANTEYDSLKEETDAELSLASGQRQTLQQEITKLKRQLEDATTQNTSVMAENADLAQRLRDTQQVLAAVKQQVASMERELQAERTKPVLVWEGEEKHRGRSWLSLLGRWFRGRRSESRV